MCYGRPTRRQSPCGRSSDEPRASASGPAHCRTARREEIFPPGRAQSPVAFEDRQATCSPAPSGPCGLTQARAAIRSRTGFGKPTGLTRRAAYRTLGGRLVIAGEMWWAKGDDWPLHHGDVRLLGFRGLELIRITSKALPIRISPSESSVPGACQREAVVPCAGIPHEMARMVDDDGFRSRQRRDSASVGDICSRETSLTSSCPSRTRGRLARQEEDEHVPSSQAPPPPGPVPTMTPASAGSVLVEDPAGPGPTGGKGWPASCPT